MFDKFSLRLTDEEKIEKQIIIDALKARYRDYRDPWGFNIDTITEAFDYIYPVYKKYFKVRVFGKENVKDEPYILASNHTGQVPIDGMMITTAFATEMENPRMLHSMVDTFLAGFPFLGSLTAETGSILGDRGNCNWLLEQGESILVFPEGMKGITKSTHEYYELRKFSNGFFRIALGNKTKILPITVIGAEEMFPFVFHAKKLGKMLGLPTLPLMTNVIPLPSPIDIYIGEPYEIPDDLSVDAPDKEIRKHVYQIEKTIKKQLAFGLRNRRPFFDKVRKPLQDILFRAKHN
jgi:1-acyl-sn-glycerol-3-phosphate acyltransferase